MLDVFDEPHIGAGGASGIRPRRRERREHLGRGCKPDAMPHALCSRRMSGSTRAITDFEIPPLLVGFLCEPAMAMGDGSLECDVEPQKSTLGIHVANVRKSWTHQRSDKELEPLRLGLNSC